MRGRRPGKTKAYSLEYVEDFSGRERRRWSRIVRRSRKVNIGQAPSRMLKKSASGVLASLRGSTYRSVRLASSRAATLLVGLFEHPARSTRPVPQVRNRKISACQNRFSAGS